MPSSPDRPSALAEARYNVARIPAAFVPVDLSTDVPRVRRRAPTDDLRGAVRKALGEGCCVPTHLGRAAEAVVASLVRPGQSVAANNVYVTGKWSIERMGGVVRELGDVTDPEIVEGAVEAALANDVALVWVTAPTAGLSLRGGNPVPLASLLELRRVLDGAAPDVPLVLDASRIVENACRVRRREHGLAVPDLVRRFVECAHITVLSGRKDVAAPHGGLILVADTRWETPLARAAELLGGELDTAELRALAGCLRALASAEAGEAAGRRVESIERLAARLGRAAAPVASWGTGALFLDAASWLPHVPRSQLPAQTLVSLLYILAGVRAIGTPAEARGHQQVVRLAVRPGAVNYLARALPAVAAACRERSSGLRVAAGENASPFLTALAPMAERDWPGRGLALDPPVLPPPPTGFGNATWPLLEDALRAQLGLGAGVRILPAPRGRGPERMLCEAADRLAPGSRIVGGSEFVRALAAFWQGNRARSTAALRIGPALKLDALLAARGPGDLVAADLGPLSSWPEDLQATPTPDVWYACDPAGPRAGGGFLAFPEDSALYRAVRDGMLFTVGSPHDGGLSAQTMTKLARRLATARDGR